MAKPLPPSFTSLYRLVLRASSATVLHTRPAKTYLRKALRPSFEAAATVIHLLEEQEVKRETDGSSQTETEMRNWLEEFDERANNTLSLMLASTHSRGLPHQTIRNISLLNLGEKNFYREKQRTWLGRHPPSDPSYRVPTENDPRLWRAAMRRIEDAKLAKHASEMLFETTRMAEGSSGLVLGRPRYIRYVPPWWKTETPATSELPPDVPRRTSRAPYSRMGFGRRRSMVDR
ncbi:hypothetical protein SCHPADRAFT_938107 [Schizopora paradoxa]|uniref:Uncharacterized protein n=1 Tax=Schizopora paradoxa TaxID=27342 RepID=A0A0H2SGL2_9AGAM|nr:hypothetical protein SCHPADRAFT_938107 [Schizopora paradoxa]